MKETAILECIDPYNKETRTIPKYRLTYGEKVWEFKEHNRRAASQQARWNLDALVFGHGDQPWFEGMDERRIPYKWRDK